MPINNNQLDPRPKPQEASSTVPTTGVGIGVFYTKDVGGGQIEGFYIDNQGQESQITNNGSLVSIGSGVFVDIATQAEAEAGTDNTKGMTPLRVLQSINSNGGSGGGASVDVQFNDVVTVSGASAINFTGGGVTVNNAGGGKATIVVPGASGGGAVALDGLTNVNVPGPTNNQVLAFNTISSLWEAQTIPGASPLALNDITNVSAPTPADGQVLKYNGTTSQWESQADNQGGGGVTTIVALTDVNISGILDGQIIAWDNANSQFVAVNPPTGGGGGASNLSDLGDVSTTGVTNGQILSYNSTNSRFEPVAAPTGGGSTDEFTFSLPADVTLNDRIAGVVGLPANWALNTADEGTEPQFGTDADTLIITWDPALSTKIAAEITIFQSTTTGPPAVQGIVKLDLTSVSDQKTNTAKTRGAAFLSGKGVDPSKDLDVFIKLI